jgi:hypothetical protein
VAHLKWWFVLADVLGFQFHFGEIRHVGLTDRGFLSLDTSLADQVFDDVAMDIGQAEVTALIAIG